MGSNLNMNGHGIKGISYLEGHGGADLLMKSNLSMNGHDVTGAGLVKGDTGEFTNLMLGGRTGTMGDPYDIWVANAVATDTLGGYTIETLMKYIDDNSNSGPSGVPQIKINKRKLEDGNCSLSIKKNTWYKVDVSSGAGYGYYYNDPGSQGDNNPGQGAGVEVGNGGAGVSAVMYIKPKEAGTWNIKFYTASVTQYHNWAQGGKGAAVEILDGTKTILIFGGGGGVNKERNNGGDAGIPSASNKWKAAGNRGSVGGSALGTGGAASNGSSKIDNSGLKLGGSGWSPGGTQSNGYASAGGGGSSYINMEDYRIIFEKNPYGRRYSAEVTIWEYVN